MTVSDPRHVTSLQSAFLQAGRELGYPVMLDQNAERQTGFAPFQFNIRDGQRLTSAEAYLLPAVQQRSNLHVALNSHVERVLFDASG